jgi:hypothetical protein
MQIRKIRPSFENKKKGYPLSSRRERGEEGARPLVVLHIIVLIMHPGDEPLQHTLITEYKLTQILNHAGSLSSEVFHSLDNQVETRVLKSPDIGICVSVVHALPLHHIEHAVDCAEGPCASTACAAVNQDGPLAFWLGILVPETGSTGSTDDLVTLLNQIQ